MTILDIFFVTKRVCTTVLILDQKEPVKISRSTSYQPSCFFLSFWIFVHIFFHPAPSPSTTVHPQGGPVPIVLDRWSNHVYVHRDLASVGSVGHLLVTNQLPPKNASPNGNGIIFGWKSQIGGIYNFNKFHLWLEIDGIHKMGGKNIPVPFGEKIGYGSKWMWRKSKWIHCYGFWGI